jgi:hypothetical protein
VIRIIHERASRRGPFASKTVFPQGWKKRCSGLPSSDGGAPPLAPQRAQTARWGPGARFARLGYGAVTKELVDLECDVVAVDSSAPQIEAARKPGLDAHVMSAERCREFDAVFIAGHAACCGDRGGWRSSSAHAIPGCLR